MDNSKKSSFEMLVGLNVINDLEYQKYREGMMPILKNYKGEFGYDFKVSEVLKSETDNNINRVFTIRFSDKDNMDAFFANEDYIKVKERYFKGSVESTTIIASYFI